MIGMQLRAAQTLSVKAAVIEHLRWEVMNIPSTVREIADAIGRSPSRVRRVIRSMVETGGMFRVSGGRYMLATDSHLWLEGKNAETAS